MNGRKREAKRSCFKSSTINSVSKLGKPKSENPITLIRGISTSMVDIPTYMATPVSLGYLSGSPGQPIVKYTRHLPVSRNRIKPDIQFQIAVLGVSIFLMVLSSLLVGAVMWFSYKYTDKEIERNFLQMFNMTEMKDIDSTT